MAKHEPKPWSAGGLPLQVVPPIRPVSKSEELIDQQIAQLEEDSKDLIAEEIYEHPPDSPTTPSHAMERARIFEEVRKSSRDANKKMDEVLLLASHLRTA